MTITETETETANIQAVNEKLRASVSQLHQQAARNSKTSATIQQEINDRYNNFISAQQMSTEMLTLYRRQRKVMWIYTALLVVLLAGLGFMYFTAYDPAKSVRTEAGRLNAQKSAAELGDAIKDSAKTVGDKVTETTEKLAETLRPSEDEE